MSVHKALANILAGMEKDLEKWSNCLTDNAIFLIDGYARQIRAILDTLPESSPGVVVPPPDTAGILESIQAKRLDEMRSQVQREERGVLFVLCQGGPCDGCSVDIATRMPEGAFTLLEGAVYQRRGNLLVHRPDKDQSS